MDGIKLWWLNTCLWANAKMENFLRDEQGEVNIIAIILIVLVVIALVAIFRKSIVGVVNSLIERIQELASGQADAAGDIANANT